MKKKHTKVEKYKKRNDKRKTGEVKNDNNGSFS